jgi:hypothetical protein
VPLLKQWEVGHRWYRCDLIETAGSRDETVQRTASLRDALKGDAPLLHRCVNVVGLAEEGMGTTSWPSIASNRTTR